MESLSAIREKPFLTAAVLGAGTMGAQIAAHLANAGLRVVLLDLPAKSGADRNSLVKKYLKAATRLKPDPFFAKGVAGRITPGNFEDDFGLVAEADWVVEAVVERLDVKREIMRRVEEHARADAVVSTNTSGIPVRAITAGLSDDLRRRTLGTHFFNPPRYLKLLELVPTADTDPAVVRRIAQFGRVHLGKGIVLAKDVPYFIGNRIGIYAMMGAIDYFVRGQYSIEEIDALTGPLVGRPKSATFRTADVVGLDVMRLVAQNLYESVPHDESRERFRSPAILDALVEHGALGAKTRAGFYRKVEGEILSLDPATMQYTAAEPMNVGDLREWKKKGSLEERVRALYEDAGRAGSFFRDTMLDTMAYAARRVGEISDSPSSIDQALRWGFGWQMGLFETWDALGFHRVLRDMDSRAIPVPDWVRGMLPGRHDTFYSTDRRSVYVPAEKAYGKVPAHRDEIRIADKPEIWSNGDAVLREIGDGVALLEFRSKANTMGRLVIDALLASIERVEDDRDLRGLVIGNTGTHFSAGANLMEMAHALQQGDFRLLDRYIATFQQTMQRVHYAAKPVVVAVHQRALGGGCELVMASPFPVAAAESYLGLVEMGVGLIPAGGGTMRLAARAARQSTGYDSDLQAFVRAYFESVAMARVATSARQAQEMGYLPGHLPVVMHMDRRFHVAAQEVIRLSELGYMPPAAAEFRVLGRPGCAALQVGIYQMHQGRYITDYDRYLAGRLAHVFTGGNLTGPQEVTEQYMLDLEREVFLGLLGQPKTQERIRGLLTNNKPVRN